MTTKQRHRRVLLISTAWISFMLGCLACSMELNLVSIVLFMLSSMLLAISSSLDLNTIREFSRTFEHVVMRIGVQGSNATPVYHKPTDGED